jgi:hypothetical protein
VTVRRDATGTPTHRLLECLSSYRQHPRSFDAKPNDTRQLERSTQRRGVHPSPSADSLARPTRISAHPRRDRGSRERARRASTSPATVATVERGERHRCISPALTGGPIDEHTINWRKYSHLLTAREEGAATPLHLSRFRLNSLIYIDHEEGREGHRAGPRPLHLSRQSVARLPSARCISPGQASHLSTELPFFSMETTTFKPLL